MNKLSEKSCLLFQDQNQDSKEKNKNKKNKKLVNNENQCKSQISTSFTKRSSYLGSFKTKK